MEKLPLYLLPGMMCNHLLWGAQVEEFSNGRDVLVGKLDCGNTIEEIAQSLLGKSVV